MMRLVLVLAMCSGCFVVPVTTTTTKVIQRTTSAPIPSAPGVFELDANVQATMLYGTASWHRECQRAIVDLLETTRKRHADIQDIDETGSLTNALAEMLLAPITMIPSGIVTAIILARSHAQTTRHEQATGVRELCPIPAANIAVAVTLPSGDMLETTTDDGGNFAIDVPETEPSGTVIVHALDADQSVHYAY